MQTTEDRAGAALMKAFAEKMDQDMLRGEAERVLIEEQNQVKAQMRKLTKPYAKPLSYKRPKLRRQWKQ